MRTIAIVFSKAPIPGAGKSRLAAEYSPLERAMIHKACLADTVAACAEAGLETEIRYGGGNPADFFRLLLDRESFAGFEGGLHGAIARASRFRAQAEGDLGERMHEAFESALARFDAAILVGSDIPGIGAGLVRDAVALLQGADLALGPAYDGGYYLIGMKRPMRGLFEGIAWSHSDVAQRTLAAAARLGLTVGMLAPRRDLDIPDDVKAFLSDTEGDESLRRGFAWNYLARITTRSHA